MVVVHHDDDYGDSWQSVVVSVVEQHFDTGDGGRNVVGGA